MGEGRGEKEGNARVSAAPGIVIVLLARVNAVCGRESHPARTERNTPMPASPTPVAFRAQPRVFCRQRIRYAPIYHVDTHLPFLHEGSTNRATRGRYDRSGSSRCSRTTKFFTGRVSRTNVAVRLLRVSRRCGGSHEVEATVSARGKILGSIEPFTKFNNEFELWFDVQDNGLA